jgi:hypothetical protein
VPIATNPWVWSAAGIATAVYAAYRYRREIAAFLTKIRDAVKAFAAALLNYVEIVAASLAIAVTMAFERALRAEIWHRLRPQRYLGSQSLNRISGARDTESGDGAADPMTGHLQPRLITLRRTAVIATLAAPPLAAPVLAAIPATRRARDVSCTPSIVINSTPTVVVKAHQGSDIEQQVLEALKRHRDELYEQWHREVRRRQRTEF